MSAAGPSRSSICRQPAHLPQQQHSLPWHCGAPSLAVVKLPSSAWLRCTLCDTLARCQALRASCNGPSSRSQATRRPSSGSACAPLSHGQLPQHACSPLLWLDLTRRHLMHAPSLCGCMQPSRCLALVGYPTWVHGMRAPCTGKQADEKGANTCCDAKQHARRLLRRNLRATSPGPGRGTSSQ